MYCVIEYSYLSNNVLFPLNGSQFADRHPGLCIISDDNNEDTRPNSFMYKVTNAVYVNTFPK